MNKLQVLKKRLLSSSLFKDSFWALTGNIFGKGLALLASILVARMLGKDLYGMYGLVRTILLSAAVFTTFGLGFTATKYIAEYVKNSPAKIYDLIRSIMQITLTSALIFAIVIFIFSRQIANYLEAASLYNSIRYLAIIVIFNSITTTQTGILAGFKRFKQVARINLTNGVATFLLSVGFTNFWGLDGALMALLISQIIICGQFYIEVQRAKRVLGVEKSIEKQSIKKELVIFSFPVAMQEMVYSIHNWVLPVLLVKLSNFGEVGLYNAAAQWSAVILFIPRTLQNVILSHVSSKAGKLELQSKILNRMLLVNLSATFVPCLMVTCFSGLIVKGYGDTFGGLSAVLNFSVYTTIFMTMSSVIRQYFWAIEKAWFIFGTQIIKVFLSFGIFILLIYLANDDNGALRMVQAKLITHFVFFIYLFFMYKKSQRRKS